MYPYSHLPTPLPNSELYMLLTLTRGENYAYKIRSSVINDSLGSLKLSPGTLYPTLERLHAQGWVDMVGSRPTDKSGTSSMYYRISDEGTLRLKEEAMRLNQAIKIMRASGLLDEDIPIDIQRLLLRSGDRLE